MALLALSLAACDSSVDPPPNTVHVQTILRESETIVAVSLPATNRVAFIDPERLRYSILPPFDWQAIHDPYGTIQLGGNLAVLGSTSGTFVTLDSDDGRFIDLVRYASVSEQEPGVVTEPTLIASSILQGGDGTIYITADSGLPARGRLFIVGAPDYGEIRDLDLPGGQNDALVNRDGTIWVATGMVGHRDTIGLTLIDPVTLTSDWIPLQNVPVSLERGPEGSVLVVLHSRDALLSFSPDGKPQRVLSGLGKGARGVALVDEGQALVAATGDPNTPSRLHVVDLVRFRVTETVELRSCPDAREVIVANSRAVIT